MKTERGLAAILREMQHDHHPIRAAEDEAARLREVAEKGDSVATPAILVVAVVGFFAPVVALLILVDFGVAHFS